MNTGQESLSCVCVCAAGGRGGWFHTEHEVHPNWAHVREGYAGQVGSHDNGLVETT